MVNRNQNNRESLQSRLLDRINTKKQASPKEIYLEEELSSEEEDRDTQNFEDRKTDRRQDNAREIPISNDIEDYDEENAADIEDADLYDADKNEEIMTY